MVRLFLAVLVSLFLSLPIAAQSAAAVYFYTGQVLQHEISFCLKKTDILEVVEAYARSQAEARTLWNEKDDCQTFPVAGAVVGQQVFAITVSKDGKPTVMRVVEIIDPETSKVAAYFMTSKAVHKSDPGAEKKS